MYNADKIISISVNYIRLAADASNADAYWSISRSVKEPEVKEALKVLGFSASQSGVEADAESRDDLEEQFSPYEWIPGGIDK